MVVFVVSAYALLCVLVGRKHESIRLGAGIGLTYLALIMLIGAELLSLFNVLTETYVGYYWIAANFLLVGLVFHQRAHHSIKTYLPKIREVFGYPVFHLLIVLLFLTLVVALASPPNNWDSLTYRLPRIEHWIQNQSIAHYPTNISRQNSLPPLAEIAILHLRILTESDLFNNLVQWLAMFGSAIFVSLIVKHFGCSIRAQLFGALVVCTVPMGILQSTSTQNDYVVTFFLLNFIERVVNFVRNDQTLDISELAVPAGLALATKGTAYIIGLPFGLWLAWAAWKKRPNRFFLTGAALVLVVLTINLPTYIRNYDTFGNVLGNHGKVVLNSDFTADNLKSNTLLHLTNNLATNDSELNQLLSKAVQRVFGTTPELNVFQLHEDTAGNFLHLMLVLLGISGALICKQCRSSPAFLVYTLLFIFAAALFVVLLAWDIWVTRLQLPLFILASVIVAVFFGRTAKKGWIMAAVSLVLFVNALPVCAYNQTRTLVPMRTSLGLLISDPFTVWRKDTSVLLSERDSLLFANKPYLRSDFENAARMIALSGHQDVGLVLNPDSWEYPLWYLLRKNGGDFTVGHVAILDAFSIKPAHGKAVFHPSAFFVHERDIDDVPAHGPLQPLYSGRHVTVLEDATFAHTYGLGQVVDFAFGPAGDRFIHHGFSRPEHWGRWTDGVHAGLRFRIPDAGGRDLLLTLGCKHFTHPRQEAYMVSLYANSDLITKWGFPFGEDGDVCSARIPGSTLKDSELLTIDLTMHDAASPGIVGVSSDQRKLGLGIEWLKIEQISRNF